MHVIDRILLLRALARPCIPPSVPVLGTNPLFLSGRRCRRKDIMATTSLLLRYGQKVFVCPSTPYGSLSLLCSYPSIIIAVTSSAAHARDRSDLILDSNSAEAELGSFPLASPSELLIEPPCCSPQSAVRSPLPPLARWRSLLEVP